MAEMCFGFNSPPPKAYVEYDNTTKQQSLITVYLSF